MILISHRGNINGPIPESENNPKYIDNTICLGYEVEIDMWWVNNKIYLGHDKPQYGILQLWLNERVSKLWIHCKNVEAVVYFKECGYNVNYFWHEEDTLTLTSHNYLWVYPGKQPIKNSIAVMPEINNDDISKCLGICSDKIKEYKL